MMPDDAAEAMDVSAMDLAGLHREFRKLRKTRRISQADAARLLSVSQATVSSFELGKYTRVRKKTLNAIVRLVRFWRGDSDKVVLGFFDGDRHAVPIRPHSAPERRVVFCPICRSAVPELEAPARFCPACGESLVFVCTCGYKTDDREANFCSRCGRVLIAEGARPHEYPSLNQDEAEPTRLIFRRRLEEVIDQLIGSDADIVLRAVQHPEH